MVFAIKKTKSKITPQVIMDIRNLENLEKRFLRTSENENVSDQE